MKKFLFTLAALLMAGSSFAANKWVVDDVVLTDAELAAGGSKIIPMVGSFDTFVSAWQADLTLPEGLTIGTVAKGADLTQTIYVMVEDEETLEEVLTTESYAPTINTANNNTRIIVSTLDKKYYGPDGEYWGTVHWAPGEWTLHRIKIQWPAGFQGGDVTITTGFSSGAAATQPRPGFIPAPTGAADDVCTFHVGKAEAPQPEAFTATPSVTFAGNVATLSYTSNDADAVATVTVNGVETAVEWNNGTATYTVEETATEPGTYNVVVALSVAPGPDASHAGDAVSANDTYTYTVKPNFVANPTITFDDNGVATLSMNANDPNATAVVTVDGTEVNVAFVNGVATLPLTLSTEVGPHAIVVAMTVSPSDAYVGVAASATNTYEYTVNPEITPAAKPVITFTPNEAGVEVNIENYTEYTIKVDGVQVDPSRALPYQVNKDWTAKTIDVYAKNDPNPALYSATENNDTYNLAALQNLPSDEAEAGTPTHNAESLIIPISGNVQSITVDGEAYVLDANGNLVLPRQDVDWTPEIVIVTNDGEHHNDATVTINDITVPAILTIPAIDIVPGKAGGEVWHDPIQDPVTGVWTPGWTEYTVDGHFVDVTFSTNVENATLYWQILKEDGTVYLEGNTNDPTKTVTITEDGKYNAVAWIVTATDESKHNKKEFEINEMTSVNELVNGKTVANVRYFNVAGQEMQEANGMTIVVTTYTDGTTSTVKVMK